MKIDKLYKSYGVQYDGKIPIRIAILMRRHPNNFNLFGPRYKKNFSPCKQEIILYIYS